MRHPLSTLFALTVACLLSPGLPTASSAAAGPDDPTVSVLLQLDVAPASTAYRQASTAGPLAARAAGGRQKRALEVAQDSVAGRAADLGARELFRVSATYAGIAVRVPADRVDELRNLPGVVAVHPLQHYELDNWASVPLTRAPEVWQSAGFTGKGVTIGIIDTGIDYTHADFGGPGTRDSYASALQAKGRGEAPAYPAPLKIAGGHDFAGNAYNSRDPASSVPQPDDNPLDCQGHGTHVAGSAAGYGVAADGSTYGGPWNADLPFAEFGIGPGVAPEATLYALKVFGCKGSSGVVLAALDWAMDPDQDGDPSDHLDVVNMSLGSPFGAQDVPLAVATQNAVLAGMSVVTAAGNSGSGYLSVGSPSTAPAAISVAAHVTDGVVVDTMRLVVDGSPRTVLGTMASTYSATNPGETTAPVTRIGDWNATPGPANDADACSALGDEEKERVKGKFLAILRLDDPRCTASASAKNADAAGAVGIIFATASGKPAGLNYSSRPLTFNAMADTTGILRDAFDAGKTVEASMGFFGVETGRFVYRGEDSRSARIAAFSSMGGPLAGTVKPDVAAPGASIFSAESGSGNLGWSTVGTSMAAPHVAGQAALMHQARPAWSALDVKSAIVNSVNQSLYAENAEQGPREDPMRAGTGRADVARSVAADAVVTIPRSPGSTSVSFGILADRSPVTRSQTVRVTDKRSSGAARTFSVRLDPVNSLPGATFSVSRSSLRLRPGQSRAVTVRLRVEPSKLTHRPDPTLDLVPEGTTFMREFLAPASALLLLETPDGPSLRVSVAAAPRPASALSAGPKVTVSGSGERLGGSLTLTGSGVTNLAPVLLEQIRSRVSALQLLGESPQAQVCAQPGCLPLPSASGADLRWVGASSDALLSAGDPLSVDGSGLAYFGIAAWGTWKTPYSPGHFTVHLDTNRDGTPDAEIRSAVLGTQIMLARLYSLRPGDSSTRPIDSVPLNNVDGRDDTAKIEGDVIVLPVRLAALAQPASFNPKVSSAPFITASEARVNFWVTSEWATPSGDVLVDAVGSASEPMVLDLLDPALTAFGRGDRSMPSIAMPGTEIEVSVTAEALAKRPRLLVLHHLNAPTQRAEIVGVTAGR